MTARETWGHSVAVSVHSARQRSLRETHPCPTPAVGAAFPLGSPLAAATLPGSWGPDRTAPPLCPLIARHPQPAFSRGP